MKTLEELAKTNERLAMTLPSDITDFETKIFGAVEQVAVESSEGIGLVRIKDLQGEKTDSVTIPKEQSPLVPTDVSEGSVVTPSKVLMDKKVISLSRALVYMLIERHRRFFHKRYLSCSLHENWRKDFVGNGNFLDNADTSSSKSVGVLQFSRAIVSSRNVEARRILYTLALLVMLFTCCL